MKISIDGTAGSGKGTLSKRLSRTLKYPYLDTGLLYRKVALVYKNNFLNQIENKNIINRLEILQLVENINFEKLKSDDLRDESIGFLASKIAKIPELRVKLNQFQINFANKMLKIKGGCILDGRDIGTNIMPNADIKIFVDASIEVRTERRIKELNLLDLDSKKKDHIFKSIFKEMSLRDKNDYNRKVSPLKIPEDALKIDTSNLTPNEVENIALNFINQKKQLKM